MAFTLTILFVTLGSAVQILGSDICLDDDGDCFLTGYFKSAEGECVGIENYWNGARCGMTFHKHNYNSMLARHKRYITGGQEAQAHGWPWAAYVSTPTGKNGATTGCTGAVISPFHVLTANHCIRKEAKSTVTLGLHDLSSSAEKQHHQVLHSKKIFTLDGHEDIALIELATKIQFNDYVSPICLPKSDDRLEEGESMIIAGWGADHTSDDWNMTVQHYPGRLKDGQVRYVGRPSTPITVGNCTQRCWYSDHQMRMMPLDNGLYASTCFGDSGSSTFKQLRGKWTTFGVTSGLFHCMKPLGNTFESVPDYVEWIRHSMAQLDKKMYC